MQTMYKILWFLSWKLVLLLVLLFTHGKGFPEEPRKPKPIVNRVPEGYDVHGIDISRHNGKISWAKVAGVKLDSNQIRFVFIKCTEGISHIDPSFGSNWNKAGEHHLSRGSYHFFLPRLNARQQALHYISNNKFENGDLPPVLDIEANDGKSDKAIATACKKWLRIIEKHYRVKPIIYTNTHFYSRVVKGRLKGYPIWIAQYSRDCPQLEPGENWHFWQHNDKGRIAGIGACVDLNVFHGDSLSFHNFCIKN